MGGGGGGGSPVPVEVCPSKPWSIYSTCTNLRAQHPLRAQIQSPEKCALRWVNIHVNNFFVCGPKFTNFFSPNVGWVVVDQLLFRFSICRSVPEISAIKVESCQKSRRTLDVFFALRNFRGQAIQKLYPRYHPWLASSSG